MVDNIIPINIEDEMKESYMNYAMSVIVSRALPDVRDGLKPVQRRVLYSMFESGILSNKPYKKSARVVGDVLGKYHPHSDAAVYDTLARMAQNFSLRYTLIDGQGNFGSIDGDSPAAMRYTEARMSRISEEMLQDINKGTVNFMPNYDNSMTEPTVLPSKIPNLLINGGSGIAVGMATKIPPHNLSEVVDGITAIIDNPEINDIELFEIIRGPDFPTGATIYGAEGILAGYKNGKGSIKVRAKVDLEESKSVTKLVVKEIPYEVNKTTLIEQIAELVKNKVITGIRDLRDESDRKGMRIVIELKKEANNEVVVNQLYKHTNMQTTFAMNMLALVDNQPKVLSLREMISLFLEHRFKVIRNRTKFDLDKALKRAHILEGLIVALDNIDEVIKIIKKASKPEDAKNELIAVFGLSAEQAQAILDMRLSRLTNLEQDKIRDELKDLKTKIEDFRDILLKDTRVYDIIKEELQEIKEKYGDERRTDIEFEGIEFEDEDLIPREDVVITLSHEGYMKRMPVDTYKIQRRGGIGIVGTGTKETDFIEHIIVTNTHNYILFFTNKGKVYWKKAYQVPQAGRQSKGKNAINLLEIEPGELISAIIPVKEFYEDKYLFFSTMRGLVKKTPLSAFSRPRTGGIIAISLGENDELIKVRITDGSNDIILGTENGKSIKFNEKNVRPMGRVTMGVRGIRLTDDDKVIGMDIATDDVNVFTITENGFGKQTPISQYPLINRGGKGVVNIKTTERNGKVVGIRTVKEGDELMLVSNDGIIIRPNIEDIPVIGRNTQGVIIMKLRSRDRVGALARFSLER